MIFLDFLSKYKKFGDRVDMFNFVYHLYLICNEKINKKLKEFFTKTNK